tara:strand:+ start:271 stop:732 length:462 start_codon:yes stop_codon:yes gene_type:complete
MNEGDQLRYGWIGGGKYGVPVGMAASEVLPALSSAFVNMNASGYAEYLDDQDSEEIFGGVEAPAETTNATAGNTVYNCIVDITAIYKVPVDTGTYAITDIGDTCDVGVTSTVQGAYLQASTQEQLIILNGDLTNNTWVIVRMNPFVQGETDSA